MNENIYLNEETEVSTYDSNILMEEDQRQQSFTACSECGNIILNSDVADSDSESYPPLEMMDVDYDSSETCPYQMCCAANSSETCKCTLESCPIDCKCSLDWRNNSE